MRLWEAESPTSLDAARETATARDYEVVGYIIAGRAELHIEGQMVRLERVHGVRLFTVLPAAVEWPVIGSVLRHGERLFRSSALSRRACRPPRST